jgi:hypothetical protein
VRRAAAIARGVLIAGFARGTLTHAGDWWRFGWSPYRRGPLVLQAFRNALLLDPGAVALLACDERRSGLVLAMRVMDALSIAVPVQAASLG